MKKKCTSPGPRFISAVTPGAHGSRINPGPSRGEGAGDPGSARHESSRLTMVMTIYELVIRSPVNK